MVLRVFLIILPDTNAGVRAIVCKVPAPSHVSIPLQTTTDDLARELTETVVGPTRALVRFPYLLVLGAVHVGRVFVADVGEPVDLI